jgi:hypothetical protein
MRMVIRVSVCTAVPACTAVCIHGVDELESVPRNAMHYRDISLLPWEALKAGCVT